MRRNSGGRWLIWSDLGERQRHYREFEPTAQAIWNRVRQADRDEGRRQDGPTNAEREELARLRRENRQLRQERDILAKAAAWFARETAVIPSGSSNS
jgi:transposase